MREKYRDSGANRAGGGRCRAQARLQTGLENNGAQSVRTKRLEAGDCPAKALADEHVAQILGYLRSSRVERGLLIDFGAPKFDSKKYALSRIGEGSRPGGLIGETLSLVVSLAPFRGLFHPGVEDWTIHRGVVPWWCRSSPLGDS